MPKLGNHGTTAVSREKTLPLYRQIQDSIRFDIAKGILRTGDLVPSERDIADKFHVSLITAKNAINGLAEEGLVVRKRGKGTFISDSEKKLIRSNSTTILVGLIMPTMKTQIDKEILNFIEFYLAAQGIHVIIRITRESPSQEESAISELLELGVQGFVIFPTENEIYSEAILRLTLDKFPHVLIDRYLLNTNSNSVCSENDEGTAKAIQYLLKMGKKRIALISPEFTNSATIERREGFERALTEASIPIDKSIWCVIPLDKLEEKCSMEILETHLLKCGDSIDAVFTVNSFLGNLTYTTLCKLERTVKSDIALVSFDKPDITQDIPYIWQDIDQMCKKSVDLLVAQISSEEEYNYSRVFVPTELIVPK